MTRFEIKNTADAVPEIFAALMHGGDNLEVYFSGREFHFYPDFAFERYYYISNNRHGLKRVAFPVTGKKNIIINGGGAKFIFHGEIIPFVIEQSSAITLKNFSVDWQRPFYSQGIISGVDENGIELKIDRERYPYHIENETIIFDGEGWSHSINEGVFEMDSNTGGPAYLSGDSLGGYIPPAQFRAVQLDEQTIRLNAPFQRRANAGNVLLLRHYPRLCPGIHLRQSRNICIENVELNHAGGMGLIAQFCENIHLKNSSVRPAAGSGRFFSVTVDATHFVNCRGLIRIEDCFFSNQMDDFINVHGINTRIKKIIDRRTVITELVHHEQHGTDIGFPGDRMNISDNVTLLAYASNTVQNIERINSRYSIIRFENDLPPELKEYHVLENMSWTPDVRIAGCTGRNNRARGCLISTPGNVVIENNRIGSSGAGIKISGDANYWFESGAVRDVVIRNNEFGDCCYGPAEWGKAVIDIDPEIADPWKNPECFHRNIRIENNSFCTFDTGILYARSVDGLTFNNNTVTLSHSYPAAGRLPANIVLDACRNMNVDAAGLSVECNHTQPGSVISTGFQPSLG
ncbi:MAG: hypothetical protein WC959_03925 [Kiritimatiellales bacterium]